MSKRILSSAAVGSMVMFLLGAVGHGVLLRHYREGTPRDVPNFPVVYASVLVLALCMAFIYARVPRGRSAITDGIWLGLIFAVAWTIPGGLARFGALQGVDMGKVLADAAWHFIEEGLGGIAIVWMQRRGSRSGAVEIESRPASAA